MSVLNLEEKSTLDAQVRALAATAGEPYNVMPPQTTLAFLASHGGLYTLLDPSLMAARAAALAPVADSMRSAVPGAPPVSPQALALAAQSLATSFFYKLVDGPGYTIHNSLIDYIAEPGKGNGVSYTEGEQFSPTVPTAFTFVGQLVDHDLTLNGLNLTVDERGLVVADEASPSIDLDNVYGARTATVKFDPDKDPVFDSKGRFKLRVFKDAYGAPRNDDPKSPNFGLAYIFDPRDDENQILLQVHVLIRRFHNQLIDKKKLVIKPGESVPDFVQRVRKEVVANWQSFLLYDYMPTVLDKAVVAEVLKQIQIKATKVDDIEQQYGDLKYKPYVDLTTGQNVLRMPQEFAIAFRYGHSQLRPAYALNDPKAGPTVVLLFKDAQASDQVTVELPGGKTAKVDGKDDLRGRRELSPSHAIDWDFFYPKTQTDATSAMLLDQLVTARVFNLPETSIPDDVKFVSNLVARNLIRSSQIGVGSGEDLAKFYASVVNSPPLTPKEVLGSDDRPESRVIFEQDGGFRTPLWFYVLREADVRTQGKTLGPVGSRLVAEILAGGMFYGNHLRFSLTWKSLVTGKNEVTFRNILDFVV